MSDKSMTFALRNVRGMLPCVAVAGFWLLFFSVERILSFSKIEDLSLLGWFCLPVRATPWAAICMVPLLIMGKYSRWFYAVVCPLACLFQVGTIFTHIYFGTLLDGDWYTFLLGTSPSEALEFLSGNLRGVLVAFALYAICIFIVIIVIRPIKRFEVSQLSAAAAIVSVVIFCSARGFIDIRNYGIECLPPTVYLFKDTITNFKHYRRLLHVKNNPQLPKDICSQDGVLDSCGIFVIGESATRNRMGIYGYNQGTTSAFEKRKDDLVVFDNYVTISAYTAICMPYLFTTRSVEFPEDYRYTMAQALDSIGWNVSLFSNVGRFGIWDGDEQYIFAGAEEIVYSSRTEFFTPVDGEMMLPIYNKINQRMKGCIVFIHIMGSHYDWKERYPTEFRRLKDDYDNSIAYTDSIIEELLSRLERTGSPAWLIYLSDHGETPASEHYRDLESKDLWEVPFVVWTSKSFQEKFPEKITALKRAKSRLVQTDQLFFGLLDFMGVDRLGEEDALDFMKEQFSPRATPVIVHGVRDAGCCK